MGSHAVPLGRARLLEFVLGLDGTYETRLGPAPALFQYALHDDFSRVEFAKRYYEAISGPKEEQFYDSDHALNAAAREDQFKFLKVQLALHDLPAGILKAVPLTK